MQWISVYHNIRCNLNTIPLNEALNMTTWDANLNMKSWDAILNTITWNEALNMTTWDAILNTKLWDAILNTITWNEVLIVLHKMQFWRRLHGMQIWIRPPGMRFSDLMELIQSWAHISGSKALGLTRGLSPFYITKGGGDCLIDCLIL
jgi:hypothetical protein